MPTDELAELIAALDRLDELHRWQLDLIDALDKLEHPAAASPTLGIDLAAKHGDIRRLLGKFGIRACLANGWDFEDLLGDLYLRIAKSNVGASPFDPARSSFGHYVVMQAQSLITNKWRTSTQRGRLASSVAIDDPNVRLQLGRSEDIDGMLDAAAAFEEFRSARPEVTEAIVEGRSGIEIARAGLSTRLGAYAARAGLRRAIRRVTR